MNKIHLHNKNISDTFVLCTILQLLGQKYTRVPLQVSAPCYQALGITVNTERCLWQRKEIYFRCFDLPNTSPSTQTPNWSHFPLNYLLWGGCISNVFIKVGNFSNSSDSGFQMTVKWSIFQAPTLFLSCLWFLMPVHRNPSAISTNLVSYQVCVRGPNPALLQIQVPNSSQNPRPDHRLQWQQRHSVKSLFTQKGE